MKRGSINVKHKMADMIELIMSRAREKLAKNDGAHDYYHAARVANLADSIRKHESGDKLLLESASYLHDWCVYGGREYHVSEKAMKEIRNDIISLRFPKEKVELLIEIVRHHEDYNFRGKQQLSKECLIFQDADRLDAMGAIGIARCFYTTATLKYPLGTPQDMHRPDEDFHEGQLTSAVQHFYTKLLRLKDSMNTDYAKKIAQERHDFMAEFLERFKSEWDGRI